MTYVHCKKLSNCFLKNEIKDKCKIKNVFYGLTD